ncbi:hypothetical protein DB30_02213 [Enhygromyxa salina]|uniref:DUF3829 domain-containing protein n=1 Tax=Enhygromyxa salina TaxID=215803 RepID=A0A0C2A3N9_9BACT|nr:DUF3829 domain-containing protein [Enhygromyxa salina]KIG17998.1 hypothetical protein DB30_02213 [Enhygromyxa salina]
MTSPTNSALRKLLPLRPWQGLAAAALMMGAAGCHLFEITEEEQPADQAVEVDPADYAERVDAKLRGFSVCRDVVASVMAESWDRYADQVGEDGKPRRKREGVFLRGIDSNTFRTCRRVLEAARTPPPMPLIEQRTIEIVEYASSYAELTREIERYLDDERWREDDWARLIELDPQLRAQHQAWQGADRELQQAVDLRHVENDPILLGVLEVRRSPLEVASRSVMIHARPMIRCMTDETTPNIEACLPLHAAFDAAAAKFLEIYERDRAAANKVFWMETFANDIEEYNALVDEFQRKSGQRKPKLSEVQALVDGYSSLVRDAETLQFDFP